jgi:hypothetical protein
VTAAPNTVEETSPKTAAAKRRLLTTCSPR